MLIVSYQLFLKNKESHVSRYRRTRLSSTVKLEHVRSNDPIQL